MSSVKRSITLLSYNFSKKPRNDTEDLASSSNTPTTTITIMNDDSSLGVSSDSQNLNNV
ncbi:unnamed protein product, partial [Rotaria magnacalcarata]